MVDHDVPLQGEQAAGCLVCGLHVPWNLKIIHHLANSNKAERWWSEMPMERLDFFGGRYGDVDE